jgi:hypothetical protein
VRKAQFLLLILFFALPSAAQPGVSRFQFANNVNDGYYMVATPGDVLWTADFFSSSVARTEPSGVAQRFAIPPVWRNTRDVTVGPDGNIWLAAESWIARIDSHTNVVARWALGANVIADFVRSGPDGNVWFMQGSSVVRMRPDGTFLSIYDAGGTPTGAAFGNDGAFYLGMTTGSRIVRITATGQRTEFPASVQGGLFAGPGFLWSGRRLFDHPAVQPVSEVVKLSYTGETLATYRLEMAPFTSDAFGNLWLRATTNEGEVVGQLSPSGVLTRFGPLPALPDTGCYIRYYGGMAMLSGGRVAMADYYPDIPRSGISPCRDVPRPAGAVNTITILDPAIAPVLSVEQLNRPQRRRSARH